MKRREILCLSPAALISLAAPAGACAFDFGEAPVRSVVPDWHLVASAAACVDSPVRCAYREWRSYHDWAVSPAAHAFSEKEMEAVTAKMTEHVDRVIATPSGGIMDTLLKLVAAIEDYQLFHGIEALEGLEAEARALVRA